MTFEVRFGSWRRTRRLSNVDPEQILIEELKRDYVGELVAAHDLDVF